MDNKSSHEKKLKILIMSAPIGSGHQMAANALEEALLRLDNVEVVQGNVFTFFPAWLGKGFLKFYRGVLSVCPSLYALSYRWSNRGGGSLWMRNAFNSVLLRLGKTFIEKVQPDVVFSTHATPTGIFSLYKRKYKAGLWLGVVVTDFTVHQWLVCPGVDAYFLADEKLFEQIRASTDFCEVNSGKPEIMSGNNVLESKTENGIASETFPSMYAWGIPVRAGFLEQMDVVAVRQEVRRAYGWPDGAFVCLLAGGGGGMLPMEEIIDSLRNEKYKDVYVISVTGNNAALHKKLEALQKKTLTYEGNGVTRLEVLGFTDAMPQLMRAADVVITKAGGVSLAECLACGAEILIYHPLPGQEQGNTGFLQREYGVAAAADIRQLDDFLQQELQVPLTERLKRQEERQRRHGHRSAAERIAMLTAGLSDCRSYR